MEVRIWWEKTLFAGEGEGSEKEVRGEGGREEGATSRILVGDEKGDENLLRLLAFRAGGDTLEVIYWKVCDLRMENEGVGSGEVDVTIRGGMEGDGDVVGGSGGKEGVVGKEADSKEIVGFLPGTLDSSSGYSTKGGY